MKASTAPTPPPKIDQSRLLALAQLPLHDDGVTSNQHQNTTAAAKMSSSQNRQQLIVPFDANRVILPSTRPNDYVNCSRILTSPSSLPIALVGEVPLVRDDLWSMVWAEKVFRINFKKYLLNPFSARNVNGGGVAGGGGESWFTCWHC